jgi:hypothetical protein
MRWIVLSVLACCGGNAKSPRAPEDGGAPDDAGSAVDPCTFGEAPIAAIDVAEIAETYSQIEALVHDGADPSFHEVTEEGSCRYFHLEPGFCDPACTGGEVCDVGNACVAYPALVSAGTLTVEGLGDPISIEPADWSPGTYVGPATLPADLFDAGDPVGARFAGDAFPAVSFAARGVASIDTALRDTGFEMRGGADAEVRWTPGPDPDACVSVVLNGSNRAHGAPLDDVIRCVGPDDGTLVVPQAMVERFPIGETPVLTEGYDWPQSELTRFTRDTLEASMGASSLVVRSTTYFRLRHPK